MRILKTLAATEGGGGSTKPSEGSGCNSGPVASAIENQPIERVRLLVEKLIEMDIDPALTLGLLSATAPGAGEEPDGKKLGQGDLLV